MGCDIHEYVEIRKPDGTWERVDDKYGTDTDYKGRKCYDLYRNYWLFGLLAGVRSISFSPIKEPRGIPADVSNGVAEAWNDWRDGHTPSFYTLKELLDIKNSKIIVTGFVDLNNYKEIKTKGVPKEWETDLEDGEVFGWGTMAKSATIVSNEEMDRLLKLMAFWDGKYYFTEYIWEYNPNQISEQFFEEFVPALEKLDPNPENVRFVFWFDN